METELTLLQAVKEGDRQAMRRLYERYVGYAMATSLRYIPSRDDAQDVVQDAFVRVFTSIASFTYRGEGSLRSWIISIVVHRALDVLRDRGRLLIVGDEQLAAELPEADPPVEQLPPQRLTQLIAQLPDGYRTVLNLHVFEGLSHKDIARNLGIKPDTSASQYLRAKRMLARLIREELNIENRNFERK